MLATASIEFFAVCRTYKNKYAKSSSIRNAWKFRGFSFLPLYVANANIVLRIEELYEKRVKRKSNIYWSLINFLQPCEVINLPHWCLLRSARKFKCAFSTPHIFIEEFGSRWLQISWQFALSRSIRDLIKNYKFYSIHFTLLLSTTDFGALRQGMYRRNLFLINYVDCSTHQYAKWIERNETSPCNARENGKATFQHFDSF